jgi:hypothetical protein
MSKLPRTPVLALVILACASAPRPVRPDDMSAQRHRQEAEHEYAVAAQEMSQYDPRANGLILPTENEYPNYYPIAIFNPTEKHLTAAEAHARHAREHEAAAAALERFEDEECKGIAPEVRASCPLLLDVTDLADVPGGARVRFTPETPVGVVAGRMRCHLAYARAHGFEDAADCPLYVRGVSVERSPDGAGIDLVSDDPTVAARIRLLLREQAVPAGGR